jgi:hypothetical protein
MLAAAAAKQIEYSLTRDSGNPKLTVFEQREDTDGFSGIQRLDGVPDGNA